ncbi:MAG: cobalt/nickel transport system ATP-binding protein [Candidatus Magnetoglobus multicellularis str. Araruama]|uniref:Cobalt/nickel transport system ATP-binding protein n=1 Tax=Candidatus Magnetoglobus multicellularis str. Araruama TaxID=890399 RepID=A0A1V1NWG4_9BACT|nr:MAG: cobalt/nickel transport system ATP-binding protein [Candidatus Magnetoglobus multicellularis str. Araruama]
MTNNNNEKQIRINLAGIFFKYPGSNKHVLDDLHLHFHSGDRIGIMAPNGSGKTTLLHIIMGILKPDAGIIEIFGKPVRKDKDFEDVRRKIGLLFQDADDQLFSPTVLEDVAFGPLNLGKSRDQAKKIALETLEELGLSGFENRITYMLSGGEKRLVALATVLSMKPEILLLDEPGAGLDEKTKSRLIDVLSKIDLSYILISHDNNFLFELSDSIYTMKNGKIFPCEKTHQHVHSHPHISHE